jgi:hypothetical protein
VSAAVREELLEPLRRVLGGLLSLRDPQGRIVCPEHGIEHTGKSAGAAALALHLSRHDPARRDAHATVAIEQARRLVANLRREGASDCHTFWPGRHDPFNSSNAIIDGGACSAALAEIVETLGSGMPADDARAFREASVLHARTYLRYAVLDKGVPAQRAWGLTGLAAAWRLARDESLERAALEALAALEAIQHADGSFPYHPLEWGAEHPGASDVTSFYHSRIPGFAMYALEALERSPATPPHSRWLRAAVEFLDALQGPDGIKCGLVEAKPWYWGAEYEVASHVFDVYAFARASRVLAEPRFGAAALRAFRAWARHLTPEGMPRSHLDAPGRAKSYQCPVFWACHAEWIARVLPELERIAASETSTREASPASSIELRARFFRDASLARIEDGVVCAWVRGTRPAANWHHGSPHGAGLVRVLRKADLVELVARERWRADQEGEWSGSAGAPSLARGWKHGSGPLRFSRWLSRNHARGGHWDLALAAPFVALERGVIDFSSPSVSSSFDLAPEIALEGYAVVLRGALAWRGGERVRGSLVERRFEVDGGGLAVAERLVERGAARDLRYRFPSRASQRQGDERGSTVSYRLA